MIVQLVDKGFTIASCNFDSATGFEVKLLQLLRSGRGDGERASRADETES